MAWKLAKYYTGGIADGKQAKCHDLTRCSDSIAEWTGMKIKGCRRVALGQLMNHGDALDKDKNSQESCTYHIS